MKTKNTQTKLVALTFAVVLIALAAIWFGWNTNSVQAVQDSEINSFSFGAAVGQTARLNVLNCGDDQGFIINWKFLDGNGSVLKRSPEPRNIPPGKTISFDVNADELNAPRDRFGRIQMRAVVKGLGGPDTFNRNASVSVEVIENATGKSALFVSREAAKGCSNNL